MKIIEEEIIELIDILNFFPLDGDRKKFVKNYTQHNNYKIIIDFENEKIDYGKKILLGDLTTSNFENSENFVVLECVDRLLVKGYKPEKISLEHKWPVGRKEKGKLDILVLDNDFNTYLMIECKTWGNEFTKEETKMLKDGGQLFSYYQQDHSAKYLCLYTSHINNKNITYKNRIIEIDEKWKVLNNQKEIYDHWNKNFKDNGVFEDWSAIYNIEIKSLVRKQLKELTEEDSGRIFNQFAEILRHNVVSDKANAFNKIFNLFLCKIIDEDKKDNEELQFQWFENDSQEELLKRLSDLYKKGMKQFLDKDITDYNDQEIQNKLLLINDEVKNELNEMFTKIRLHKNNEFAFKEVFNEKTFEENAIVVKEVVELLQPYQIRYTHKQQFLGNFFELLLNTGLKQESGQFFTPVPIAKFIISCLPIKKIINDNLKNNSSDILPYAIDYAAGSGHFLTEFMDEVQNIINEIDESIQKPSIKRYISSWKINPFDWASQYVYGIEADYRLVKTAKVSCFLNGDGFANIIHGDGLDNFEKSSDYKGLLKYYNPENKKENNLFDVLIANPPYSVSSFKNTLKNASESFELFSDLTDSSKEIECLFIERVKHLLKPEGVAGLILPSSILSNGKIYIKTREIILKYFEIISIVEFGSHTFMATQTGTIAIFLKKRKENQLNLTIEKVNCFLSNYKDITIYKTENAFSCYVADVYPSIKLQDYISLLKKEPNDIILKEEFFEDYTTFFNEKSEIKKLKTKKEFKKMTPEEQKDKMNDMLYNFIYRAEKDKLIYFMHNISKTILIAKTGKQKNEKKFIGYEFSNRRGHEGIKMFRNKSGKLTTKLYSENDFGDEKKLNTYIYNLYLNNQLTISDSLDKNIKYKKINSCIDFHKPNFKKSISLDDQHKINWNEIWESENLMPLVKISDVQKGTTITEDETEPGIIPVVAGGKKEAYYHNSSNRNGNIITISASGKYAGFVAYWEKAIFASDCNTISSLNEDKITTKLIYLYLKAIQKEVYSLQRGQGIDHVYGEDINKIKIPFFEGKNYLIEKQINNCDGTLKSIKKIIDSL